MRIRNVAFLSGLALLAGLWLLACRSEPSLRIVRADRLYSTAPPVIPHPVKSLERRNCLACHGKGSRVAPPSPHPDLVRCRQCHVAQKIRSIFRRNTFKPVRFARGLRAHPKAPPLIPHPLTMRENCLACHAGRFARSKIRSSHPGRSRCRQCHVPAHQNWPQPRPNLTKKQLWHTDFWRRWRS